jgi:hypothetical protein
MQLTIDLPENLALSLQSNRQNLSQIFEVGLREFKASSSIGYKNVADVLEFLASLPTPEEILELRPSEALQAKINELLEISRNEGLNESEQMMWEGYEFIEHLVRLAKSKALSQLKK